MLKSIIHSKICTLTFISLFNEITKNTQLILSNGMRAEVSKIIHE